MIVSDNEFLEVNAAYCLYNAKMATEDVISYLERTAEIIDAEETRAADLPKILAIAKLLHSLIRDMESAYDPH